MSLRLQHLSYPDSEKPCFDAVMAVKGVSLLPALELPKLGARLLSLTFVMNEFVMSILSPRK